MTFTGSLKVKQTGDAILHIDEYHEDYLIPFPDFSVKGFLSGTLYPEISGTYHIVSSSDFVTELRFSGKGYFSGTKNHLEAIIYRRGDESKTPIMLFEANGARASRSTRATGRRRWKHGTPLTIHQHLSR